MKNNIEESNIEKDLKKSYQFNKWDLFEVLFLATVWCNLKCSFCCEQWNEENVDPDISINNVLNLAKELNFKLVDINWGEPLLRGINTIKKFINTFKENWLNVSISSNGVLLTDEFVEFLKDKIDIFNISLHGNNNETNDWLMWKKWVSEIIKRNIQKLIEKNIDVHVTCVVVNKNITEIESLAKRCKDNWVKTLCLNRVFGRWKGIDLLQEEQPDSDDLNIIHQKVSKEYEDDNFHIYINHSHIGQCILLRPDWNVSWAPKDPRSSEDWLIKIWDIWKDNMANEWEKYNYSENHFLYNKEKFKRYTK